MSKHCVTDILCNHYLWQVDIITNMNLVMTEAFYNKDHFAKTIFLKSGLCDINQCNSSVYKTSGYSLKIVFTAFPTSAVISLVCNTLLPG